MSEIIASHLARVEAQLSAQGLSQMRSWIEKNTKLKGENFSFKDHEYQIFVIEQEARDVSVRKCSQIGLSELSARYALAACNLVAGFTTIYTLPTATFAWTFAKTRFDPVIAASPYLSAALNPKMDNSEIKQFGESFLYIKGTFGASAAISVPADLLVHDEVDFSDEEVMSNYESRLTHSKYKRKRKFSTPTVGGYGITAEFDASRRYWLMAKCDCCGHSFVPDYFEHVRLPGFKGDSLRRVTRNNAHLYKLDDAFVECPRCGGRPDLSMPNREWVCENPEQNFDQVGIQIQPFDAPKIITPGDLIRASTKYHRYADFVNFNLGLPAEDAESSFQLEELRRLFVRQPPWHFTTHVMGGDMGVECHILIAGVTPYGDLRVVHQEVVGIRELEARRAELARQYRVTLSVFDLYPYSETIWRMQQRDPNLWAASFMSKRSIETYTVEHKQADASAGQQEIRQINVNRNRALDGLMEQVRQVDGVLFAESDHMNDTIKQMMDMKRIKDIAVRSESGEEVFVWRKSKNKNDHWHHALLYVWLAAQLRGLTNYNPLMSPILGTFKTKT